MTEADLLAQLNSTGEFLWSLIQYWTSISIGILIGAHLVGRRLNAIFLSAFLVAYVVFTVQIARLIRMQVQLVKGIYLDLSELAESSVGLGNYGLAVIEHSPLGSDDTIQQILRVSMMLIMFLVTVAYPIYCKLKSGD